MRLTNKIDRVPSQRLIMEVKLAMRQLRSKAINELLADLDRSLFTRHAFDCSFNTADGALINIKFKDHPDFYFKTRSSSEQSWTTEESPGEAFIDAERYSSSGNLWLNVKSRMNLWTQRVLEEYTVKGADVSEIIKHMRENVERRAEELDNPNEPFSKAEDLMS